MIRLSHLFCCLLVSLSVFSNTIIVKNEEELKEANKKAQPGDIIILQNGAWNNVEIKLNCKGTKEAPISFKAETAGKVLITGNSQLKIGGDYIIVDGLFFTNGYAGEDAVITFRTNKDNLANNCRVTNCAIDNFNNPKRMDENYWVAFYGKNNRLDHCSFRDKNNMGVLLAVILDDERSRENFHSIDHNYFGRRIPLASNGGEIIRVGVSQHCQFNSNTQITDNFFEHCDGETEIVSIKSGSNLVKGNLFKECQGSVVLRHGDNNTVENNIFLGNNKTATGGVRVINKGQWIINNFFYKCRGTDFRSPLAIMNGIPNSPANRYVQVTDAVIANNTFMECSPISFGEGSDAERSLPPDNVLLFNNLFFNSKDSIIYKVFDDVKGIRFNGNELNGAFNGKKGALDKAFIRRTQVLQRSGSILLPRSQVKGAVALPDSLMKISQQRLGHPISTKPGFNDLALLKRTEANAYNSSGAKWFKQTGSKTNSITVSCAGPADIYVQLEKKEPVIILLTGDEYKIERPFIISKIVQLKGVSQKTVRFVSDTIQSIFVIEGDGQLSLQNIAMDGSEVKADHFISNSKEGSSAHYSLSVRNCDIYNFGSKENCDDIFFAYKSMVADSIVVRDNSFRDNKANTFRMTDEKDDKGYYNAEKIVISNNSFNKQEGSLVSIYRGGNDESTLGPNFIFSNNAVLDCHTKNNDPLILFTGVQVTTLSSNQFTNCNSGYTLIKYTDIVRARHLFENNRLTNSGQLEKNQFLTEKNNRVK